MPEAAATVSPSSSSPSPPPSTAATGSPSVAPASPPPAPSPAPAAAARPDWAYDRHWDAQKGELKGADLRSELDGLIADKAAETSRKASVPAPDKYELKFNADYKLPAGIEWSWDAQDAPLINEARAFANATGMSQDNFSKLLGLYASSRVGEQQMITNAKAAELAKLGANANTRVDAVKTWLSAMAGDNAAAMLRVLDQAPVAGTVEAFETLIQRFTSQGVSGNPAGGRDGNSGRQPTRLSDAEYAKLTYTEKVQYAQQFDQTRFNGRAP
jgi:hypothetical protein